jgi:hypothetical protein
LIKQLLRSGINFVLTRRLSTDKIERFHGAVRHYYGSNHHPAVANCLSVIEAISRTQLALTSLSCNTPLPTEAALRRNDHLIASERQPKITRPRGKTILMNTSSNHLKILNQLKETPGIDNEKIIT